ncbi:MAG: hypothetical protein QW559_02745 [Candidatus Woesearchaeota archaeon]
MGIFDMLFKKKVPAEAVKPLTEEELQKSIVSELPEIKGRALAFPPEITTEAQPLPKPSAPTELPKEVFVSVDDYKAIVDGAEYIKGKLGEVETLAGGLQDIKKHIDRELELWKASLENVEKKLAFVEELIARGQSASEK